MKSPCLCITLKRLSVCIVQILTTTQKQSLSIGRTDYHSNVCGLATNNNACHFTGRRLYGASV